MKTREKQIRKSIQFVIVTALFMLSTSFASAADETVGQIETQVESENQTETPSALSADLGGTKKTFTLNASPRAAYSNWFEVGATITETPRGTGTEKDPYEIWRAEDLAWFLYQMNQGGIPTTSCIELMNDIDLLGESYGGTSSSPIQWVMIQPVFEGIFAGGGYTISHFYMTGRRNHRNGMFDQISGTVKDIVFEDGEIQSTGAYLGVLGCNVLSGAVLEGVINKSVDISGETYCGGIISEPMGDATTIRIEKCGNFATIQGAQVGGIMGSQPSAGLVMTDCFNSGTVIGTSKASGITPTYRSARTTLINCYNAGTLSAPSVSQLASGGGVIQQNCYYNSGDTPVDTVSGLTGLTEETMKSKTAVDLLNAGRSGENQVWYMDNIGMNGGYPVPRKNLGSWLDVGGFEAQAPLGDGTELSPYQIGSEEELAWFLYQANSGTNSDEVLNSCAELVEDVNLRGINYGGTSFQPLRWVPIGGGKGFSGTFNGNNHKITNLYLNGSGILGFFGTVSEGGTVKNLIINSSEISGLQEGTNSYVGAIAGKAEGGSIEGIEVASTVTITGTYVGGIAGDVSGNAQILKSDNNGIITAGGSGGGIAGTSSAGKPVIRNCYNKGTVTGGYAGGIFGHSTGGTLSIGNSYHVGTVTGTTLSGPISAGMDSVTCTNSCYDNGFATIAEVDGIIGYSTQDMMSTAAVQRLNTGNSTTVWYRDNETAMVNDGYPIYTGLSWEMIGKMLSKNGHSPMGNGGAYNPYLITTAEDLAWFLYQVNSGDNTIHGELTGEIDLSGTSYISGGDHGLLWDGIAAGGRFKGGLDGNGYGITNFYGTNFVSNLYDGTLRNLGLESGTLNGEDSNDTGLVGTVGQGGLVEQCYNKVDITVTSALYPIQYAGGIAAKVFEGTVKNCFYSGTITANPGTNGGNAQAGGIAGLVSSGTVDSCYVILGGISMAGANSQAGTITGAAGGGGSNCYYVIDKALPAGVADQGAKKSKEEMQTLEMTRLLNKTETLTSDGPWYLAGNKNDDTNNGYPIFQKTEIASWNDWYKYFLDTEGADYNMAGTYYLTAGATISLSNITKSPTAPFTGNLIGSNTTLTNLTTPLFSTVEGRGMYLTNFKLVTGTGGITQGGSNESFGVLANTITGTGRMENLSAEGILRSSAHYTNGTGGLVGNLSANAGGSGFVVNNCETNVDITVNGSQTGGISGGLAGKAANASFTKCRSMGDTVGENGRTGGLIGQAENCRIDQCYTSGSIGGSGNLEAVGGLVGAMASGSGASRITNCYSSSDLDLSLVSNQSVSAGGIAGKAEGTISGVYYSGRIDLEDPITAKGVLGSGGASVSAGWYDSQMSGVGNSSEGSAGISKITSELVGGGLKESLPSDVWSFAEESTQTHLSGYPRLTAFEDDAAYASIIAIQLKTADTVQDVSPTSESVRLADSYGDGNPIIWTFSDEKIALDSTTNYISYGEDGKFPKGQYTLTAAVGSKTRSFTLQIKRIALEATLSPVSSLPAAGSEVEWSSADFGTETQYDAYTGVKIRWMKAGFEEEESESSLSLTNYRTIQENYSVYGSTNADSKIGLVLLRGNTVTDLSGANPTGTGITGIRLYNAAAYHSAQPRYVEIVAGDTEIRLTIEAVTYKEIDLVVPINPAIELTPGMEDTAYTENYKYQNHCAFPMTIQVSSVTPLENQTYSLALVKDKAGIAQEDASELTQAGVTLSMMNTEEESSNPFVYPMISNGNPTQHSLGSGESFVFRYRMEYNPLFLGAGGSTFGYTIMNQVAVSPEDYSGS